MKIKSSTLTKVYAFILSIFFTATLSVKAQQPSLEPNPTDSTQPLNPEVVQIVEMKKADLWSKREGFEAEVLTGNVVFFHEGAYMYCDSAYLYEQSNSFEAFSNVTMEQGDTLFVHGDYLHYDGYSRLARLRDNIIMEDQAVTLFTDSLNYDRLSNIGYYFDGGMLIDEENELTSLWGQYSPDTKDALFSDSVKLINKDYTIYSDTLKYNTVSKIADILGPSRIVSDSGFINTDRGWYNTLTENSRLLDRSQVFSNDGKKVLIGDTIYYNRLTGEGEVFGDMFLEDKEKKAILKGNYGFYNEQTEYGMATDSAYAIDYSQQDTLFLHGDTLVMATDSTYRDIKAYYKVRFYRSDIQGICDSLHYSSRDSMVYMRGDPVIWNDNNQILGYQIDVYLNDSTIEKAAIKDNAFAIQDRGEKDQYNQLSGKNITAMFNNGEVYNVLVEGNAESLYYLVEDDGKIIGLNKTESPYLSMDIEKAKLKKLKIWPASTGNTKPLSILQPDEIRLKGFTWLDYLRPQGATDIFRSNQRRKGDDDMKPKKRFEREDITL